MRIWPVGAELFHADGQTDGQIDMTSVMQTDMTKAVVTCHDFVNTPNEPAGTGRG
jgi:hypothetical protein